ncbi:MAG: type II secretion system protein [Candidatus Saccharibacteria bacterium]
MNIRSKSKGFTIIEVVLVLAIAGLIFLMVFIALPSLQKSQRDTQRKNDLSRILVQMTNYASNNRGSIPDSLIIASATGNHKSFVQNYLDGTDIKTSGTSYAEPKTGSGYVFLATGAVPANTGEIGYATSSKCGTDGAIVGGQGARQFAMTTILESQSAVYCVDNQ